MILGVLSDTHDIDDDTIRLIIDEFRARKVDLIIHCGDIEAKHFQADLFGNFKVVCALIEEQRLQKEFTFSPAGWAITKPNDRIVNLGNFKVYVGHKRSWDFMIHSEANFEKVISDISLENDGVRWMFAGHTHHQIYKQGTPCSFINPGAIQDSFDGHCFAIVDTDTKEVVFSRNPLVQNDVSPFTVGIVSDTGNISQLDKGFWAKLKQEFSERDVSTVIHGGNIKPEDIGRSELSSFQVYYYLMDGQDVPESTPENWYLISREDPVVEIAGYRFFVEYGLGVDFFEQSEIQMSQSVRKLSKKYQHVDFVICGLVHNALFAEGQEVKIVNPGDARNQRKFATVCLPRSEVTFGQVRLRRS